jgi:hypothetical protein
MLRIREQLELLGVLDQQELRGLPELPQVLEQLEALVRPDVLELRVPLE